MPSLNRAQKQFQIRDSMKRLISNLNNTIVSQEASVFPFEASRSKFIIQQLKELVQHTDQGAAGYLSQPRVRQTFAIAARELEAILVQLDDWAAEAQAADTREKRARIVNKLMDLTLALGKVQLSPPISRPIPTKAEVAQIKADETSPIIEDKYKIKRDDVSTDANLHKIPSAPLNPAEAAFLDNLRKDV